MKKELKRKIRHLGGACCITLPKEAIDQFGWINKKSVLLILDEERKEIVIKSAS